MKRDYGRTTITVPFGLKARMKQVGAEVNWSAVACDAFEQKLAEIGPIEEITSVESAIKRMKSLPKNPGSPDGDCQSGKEAGIHWALNFARPDQLARIEEYRDGISDQDWEPLLMSREGWRELARCIEPHPRPRSFPDDLGRRPKNTRRHRHQPRGERGPGSEKEIWQSILDRRPDHPGFFLGFANGALEIWKQIKDQF